MSTADGLPVLNVQSGFRKGRNPSEGYARGWGLEFGTLQQQVENDPVYTGALQLAAGRTVQTDVRRINLFLLIKHFLGSLPKGNVAEFGSWKGGSALFMSKTMQRFAPQSKLFAFDTYEGIPYADDSIDAHSAGDFSGVDLSELRFFAANSGLTNLQFIKGRFEDTLPSLISSIAPLSLVHIDCDVHDAVLYAYEQVKDYMVPGGYIVFDDATTSSCIGATEVVEEIVIRRDGLLSEQVFPHFVFRAPLA